jgi:hypothetical protein
MLLGFLPISSPNRPVTSGQVPHSGPQSRACWGVDGLQRQFALDGRHQCARADFVCGEPLINTPAFRLRSGCMKRRNTSVNWHRAEERGAAAIPVRFRRPGAPERDAVTPHRRLARPWFCRTAISERPSQICADNRAGSVGGQHEFHFAGHTSSPKRRRRRRRLAPMQAPKRSRLDQRHSTGGLQGAATRAEKCGAGLWPWPP